MKKNKIFWQKTQKRYNDHVLQIIPFQMETVDEVLHKEQLRLEMEREEFSRLLDQEVQKALDREISKRTDEMTDLEVQGFKRWYMAYALEHFHEIFE